MLCSVPAFRALRKALPLAKITLIGLPWEEGFTRRFGQYLDDFIEFPGYPGLPERAPQISRFPEFLKDVQSRYFDLALQMQGSGRIVNSLVMLFGSTNTAGFYEAGEYYPEDCPFMEYPATEPEVWRHLHLMEFLGIPVENDDLEFPLLAEDWEELQRIEAEYGLKRGQYAVIHAGSRKADRRWSIDRFAALADSLAGRGMDIVLTGTNEECTLTKALAVQMQSRSVNLAGQTSLGGLGALLKASRVLVCNDTGVSHLADALNVPSVVLFTAPDEDRWAPKDQELHRVLANAPSIEPDRVVKEVNNLLKEERIHVFQP